MIFCLSRLKSSASATFCRPWWSEVVLRQCQFWKWFQLLYSGATLRSWPSKACLAISFGKGFYSSSLLQAEDTSNASLLTCPPCCSSTWILYRYDTNILLLSQGAWRVSCHLCGICAFQDDHLFHSIPDCLLAAVLWNNLDPYSWCFIPPHDHASSSCEAVLPPKAFQRSTPYRFRCGRVWRVTGITIQSSSSESSCSLHHKIVLTMLNQWLCRDFWVYRF